MRPLFATLTIAGFMAWGGTLESIAGESGAEFSGIASYGQDLYQGRCSNCHSNKPGESSLAPTLHGLMGRKAGGVEGFPYGEKISRLELVWSKETFEAWIGSQSLDSPILRMRHLGVDDPGDRASLSAYLETLK